MKRMINQHKYDTINIKINKVTEDDLKITNNNINISNHRNKVEKTCKYIMLGINSDLSMLDSSVMVIPLRQLIPHFSYESKQKISESLYNLVEIDDRISSSFIRSLYRRWEICGRINSKCEVLVFNITNFDFDCNIIRELAITNEIYDVYLLGKAECYKNVECLYQQDKPVINRFLYNFTEGMLTTKSDWSNDKNISDQIIKQNFDLYFAGI